MQKTLPRLLTTNNVKILKGESAGYMTAGIHLAPATLSGRNTCPAASAGCRLACLNTSGHGRYGRVQQSRIAKTKRFFNERETFMRQLVKEIAAFVRKAARNGKKAAIRLNLTSDIQWENVFLDGKTIFAHFPDVPFYDYTKIIKRVLPKSAARAVPNYHLTFSRSESNDSFVSLAIKAKANVAVVFNRLPKTWRGKRVVNGDETDLRFLDKKGVIVGLTPKGRAKKDESGFVVNVKGGAR